MRIALLSKADSHGGGASRVACDLHKLFKDAGHQADHWLCEEKSNDDRRFNLYGKGDFRKLLAIVNKVQHLAGLAELLPLELANLSPHLFKKKYDVLHFHDISSVISPLTVLLASHLIPTLWTFHDYSPFTGGCIYPMDCEKYKKDCKKCPQYRNWPFQGRMDLVEYHLTIKKILHCKGKLANIAPSQWMADTAFDSGMLKTVPHVIHNAVDSEIFKPSKNIDEFKNSMGISPHRKTILLLANHLDAPRKGTKYAFAALRAIKKEFNPVIMLVGNQNKELLDSIKDFDVFSSGYLDSDSMKSLIFSAADIFLNCSLADNLPLTVLETSSCGVPTVGFATGGIPEMVKHMESGYLVPQHDTDALVNGLRIALSNDTARQWGKEARRLMKANFSLDLMYRRHIDLYEKSIFEFKNRL